MDIQEQIQIDTFGKDVIKGLTSKPKRLFSKYFYDDEGSRIFQEIMNMPEYYLTNAEHEILRSQSQAIFDSLGYDQKFNILELGAGDGLKTKSLLKNLIKNHIKFSYTPVDISAKALELLQADLLHDIPELDVQPITGDYFELLQSENAFSEPVLLLFLGSNIGNYEREQAIDLLKLMRTFLKTSDRLLIGIDLKKDPNLILNAYNDPHGITRRFNLNLLNRMNKELQADFNIAEFGFYPFYNPATGEVRSFIYSKKCQTVHFKKLGIQIEFDTNEMIHTELSKKYAPDEIEIIAKLAGFQVKKHFMDPKKYFTDSLLLPI